MKTISTFFLLLLMVLTDSLLLAADIPYLTGRVTDNAEILSEDNTPISHATPEGTRGAHKQPDRYSHHSND